MLQRSEAFIQTETVWLYVRQLTEVGIDVPDEVREAIEALYAQQIEAYGK